ncbi:MAG: cyclic nucleotide-binding domain-containing protein [Pseudomonadota bacterium]|nr:cyclic nucleotide-binding domain-containing protein [Pseudomonadota bacterium]
MTEKNPCEGNLLSGIDLFAGLSAQELDAVATRGVTRTLRGSTVFIQEGEEASSLYLVLAGKVKVYTGGTGGEENVLNIKGPGEHLGELALMGDSVRTASAMTLEDSRFLVLSRRGFMECLDECPQIALNLDDDQLVRTTESDLGMDAAKRYLAWSTFRRSGTPLILLIGGCTGTGKSTVAAELSLRLDIGRTQSTDMLREVVRLFVSEESAPELHASTYAAWQARQAAIGVASGEGSQLVDGFRAQAASLATAMDGVIERSVRERASTIIEGIHVHPAYHEHLSHHDALFVPLLLTNPSQDALKRHFARRGQKAPSRSAGRYLENFTSIWQLQTYLIEEAARRGVPMIPNIQLVDTVRRVMEVITDALLVRLTDSRSCPTVLRPGPPGPVLAHTTTSA